MAERGPFLTTVALTALLAGCSPPSGLPSDAYVWNRRWTGAVRDAVARRPAGVRALRVLVGETGPAPTWVALDVSALGDGPVIPVLRVGGALPDGVTWRAFEERAEALRGAGVEVSQVEVDYDAPSNALGEYAGWLEATRPGLSFARSITALPSWVARPEVRRLSAAVDEVVLQVHTVRAPVLFDADAAVTDARGWAQASGRPFRVALPAYRALLASGEELAASPDEVALAMRALAKVRLVTGFVFFRLGNAEDRQAWSPPTLEAVLARRSLEPHVVVSLVPFDATGSDLWLENQGATDAVAPSGLAFGGELDEALATTGYRRDGVRFSASHPLWLRPGERLRIGSVRGRNLQVQLVP